MTHSPPAARRKAVWGLKRTGAALLLLFSLATPALASGPHVKKAAVKHAGAASRAVKAYKTDDEVSRRATDTNLRNTTPVIVELVSGAQLPPEFKKYSRNRKLGILNGEVLELPNHLLARLAAHPNVFRVHYDRPIKTHNYRTSITVGARTVQDTLGYTGAGIGIAVIDSGVAAWHDDLTNRSPTLYPYGNQRVAKFVDFVNGRSTPYRQSGQERPGAAAVRRHHGAGQRAVGADRRRVEHDGHVDAQ